MKQFKLPAALTEDEHKLLWRLAQHNHEAARMLGYYNSMNLKHKTGREEAIALIKAYLKSPEARKLDTHIYCMEQLNIW